MNQTFRKKKIAVALSVALAAGGTGFLGVTGLPVIAQAAAASTSTGFVTFTDKTAIKGGDRTLNLAIGATNALGNIDVSGDSAGSVIIARVSSNLGTVQNVSGGVGVGVDNADGARTQGAFAATNTYIELANGVSQLNIVYANPVSGTDVIQVDLYERTGTVTVGYTTRLIKTETLSIPVSAATASTGVLSIDNFTKAASDGGALAATANDVSHASMVNDNGIALNSATMTAGAGGGTFTVNAYKISAAGAYTLDTNANGSVTVTLTGDPTKAVQGNKSSTVYTLTGSMSNGVAVISVPSSVTKAGTYKVVATMGDVNSIPPKGDNIAGNNTGSDWFDVAPQDATAKLGLASDMSTISVTTVADVDATAAKDGVYFDPVFTVTQLDQFGNKIRNAAATALNYTITDANGKISDISGALAAAANTTRIAFDGSTASAGAANLTVSIPTNSLIAASAAAPVKIVSKANQLVTEVAGLNSLAAGAQTVGTTFALTPIGVDNVANDGRLAAAGGENGTLASTDNIKVTALATGESLTVGVTNGGAGVDDSILGRFTKPLTAANVQTTSAARVTAAGGAGLLIQHANASYADTIVGAKTTGGLSIAAGSPATGVLKNVADASTNSVRATFNGTNYVVSINDDAFRLNDAFGNNVTAAGQTVTATSTAGTASGAVDIGDGVDENITVTYPATATSDTLTFTFNQPGVPQLTANVVFPAVGALASFDVLTQNTTIPQSGRAPILVQALDASGKPVASADPMFVDYDSTKNAIMNTACAANIANGANFAAVGRYALCFNAGTTPGTYPITIRDAGSTVSKVINIVVPELNVTYAFNGLQSGTLSAATVKVSANIATADVGKTGQIYIAALVGSQWYFYNSTGSWVLWTGGAMPAYKSAALANTGDVTIVNASDLTSLAGTEVFVGYGLGTGTTADNEMLASGRYKNTVTVQ